MSVFARALVDTLLQIQLGCESLQRKIKLLDYSLIYKMTLYRKTKYTDSLEIKSYRFLKAYRQLEFQI